MSEPIDYKHVVMSEAERAAAEDRDLRNQQVFRESLSKYAYASHRANFSIILDFCSGEFSMPKIDSLMNTEVRKQLDWKDERPALIDALLTARQYPDVNVRGVVIKGVDAERKRLQLLDRVALIDRLATMLKKNELSKYTAVELKQGLAEHRKATSNIPRYAGYENLPRNIVPKGFVSAVDTGEYLRHVAKTDLRTFQYFVRRYGSEQVNEFLNS